MTSSPLLPPLVTTVVFPVDTSPTLHALMPNEADIGRLVLVTICLDPVPLVCYVRFGSNTDTTVSDEDMQLWPNNLYRFEIGPASRYMALMPSAVPTAGLAISWYREGVSRVI